MISVARTTRMRQLISCFQMAAVLRPAGGKSAFTAGTWSKLSSCGVMKIYLKQTGEWSAGRIDETVADKRPRDGPIVSPRDAIRPGKLSRISRVVVSRNCRHRAHCRLEWAICALECLTTGVRAGSKYALRHHRDSASGGRRIIEA